ncbi:MAG: hypothetical protein EA409_05870 [Saprospirales bacterium]|nr:MAG: hypothetical protein EA409_05870 [Saprospirales bacterium]
MILSCKRESGLLFEESIDTPIYPASILTKVWEKQISFLEDEQDEKINSFHTVEDQIIVITDHHIYCYSAEDGRLSWTIKSPLSKIWNNIVRIVDDQIYFLRAGQSCHGNIVVINRIDGVIQKQFNLNLIPEIANSCREIYFRDGKVYIAAIYQRGDFHDYWDYFFRIYRFDLVSESLELLFSDDSSYYTGGPSSINFFDVDENAIFIPYYSYRSGDVYLKLLKIGHETGEVDVFFSKKQENLDDLPLRSFVVSEKVFVNNFKWRDGVLISAYDVDNDATLIWEEEIPHNFVFLRSYTPVILSGKLILVGNDNRTIERRDIFTGEVIWKQVNKNRVSPGFFPDQKFGVLFSEGRMAVSLIQMKTGSYLTTIHPHNVGSERTVRFIGALLMDHGEKLLVLNEKGRLACFELPF